MDWEENVKAYKERFAKSETLEEQLHLLARFSNSWHNAHHARLDFEGVLPRHTEELALPFQIFGQGSKLSEAQFFISSVNPEQTDLRIGDEVLKYNDIPVREYLLSVRDEERGESPESIIESTALKMAFQWRCPWEKVKCWKKDESVKLEVKRGQETLKLGLFKWRALKKNSQQTVKERPMFPPEARKLSFKILHGTYSENSNSGDTGFIARLNYQGKVYLLIKLYEFRSDETLRKAIEFLSKPGWDGILLDFKNNGGGDDSSFALMASLLGKRYHVELGAVRLVEELKDPRMLREAAVYNTNMEFITKLIQDKRNYGKFSPFIPFQCKTVSCEPLTEISHYLKEFDIPSHLPAQPKRNLALITSSGTVSKSDSINVLFHSHAIGPTIGTPAMASSARYYFKKRYIVRLNEAHAITFLATFTPDFSVTGGCQEVQANPPRPHVLVEKTFENRQYYDALTWIKAISALDAWKEKISLEPTCTPQKAEDLLKQFGYETVLGA